MQRFDIVVVEFPTQFLMCWAMMRPSEFSESDDFQGRIGFTKGEFLAADTRRRRKLGHVDDYLRDWVGFNIPAVVLMPFREGGFDPLDAEEQKLLEITAHYTFGSNIVAVCDEKPDLPNLKHEVVHGLWQLCEDYKHDAQRIVQDPITEPLRGLLQRDSYAEHALDDEVNAYVLTGLGEYARKCDASALRAMRQDLDRTFKRHFGFSMRRASRERVLTLVHVVRFPDSV